MSYSKPTSIYCNSGIFTCIHCNYNTSIYTDKEWLDLDNKILCDNCQPKAEPNSISGYIFRDDIDPETPLHLQMTHLPVTKKYCTKCSVQEIKIHWTEQHVQCPHCKKDSMLFTEYSIGVNMEQFYKDCLEALKSKQPLVEWIDHIGHSIYVIKGTGDQYSAS
ncbi:MAG: hypothetical protein CFE25_05620 [Chitinophagaceae bacterium BSSC1]|nr:MAG: hypothetical protein CFE25_05620 [Chitinophagaceae bacterium BSSC1]